MKQISLKPGEYSFDNSPHRYDGKVRYEWEAVNNSGKYRRGLAVTREEAENRSTKWANN